MHSEPPPLHQPDPLDPMIFDYPDLAGSVRAVFDTQLPGAAIDQMQDSQVEPEVTGSGGLPPTSRGAEKAPARDPPSFGLFGTSQDRTQDLFFSSDHRLSQQLEAPGTHLTLALPSAA